MSVLIVDYHMGNLGSVRRALEECGASVILSDDPHDLKKADRFVLPGVGAFRDGMDHLNNSGWTAEIRSAVADGLPMLGICLGMQLLFEKGDEGGETAGLALISGKVKRFEPGSSDTRIPHVGWNEVRHTRPSVLFEKIPSGTDFYFVHSYCAIPEQAEHIIAETPYCGSFASAVAAGSVMGVQFHPEKSGRPGFQLLRNFLKL